MSALAQSHSFNASFRSWSELEALQEISRDGSRATNPHSGVTALIQRALRVKGIGQIVLESTATRFSSKVRADWETYISSHAQSPKPTGSAGMGSAVARITSQGRTWGNVRVFFHVKTHTLDSPLRFARFIGQQLGGLLMRFELLECRDVLLSRNDALRRRTATRKVAQRAAGLIAESRNISTGGALLLLIRLAHESRRSLAHVAEAIVLAHCDLSVAPPKLRRLHPAEFTSTLPGLEKDRVKER